MPAGFWAHRRFYDLLSGREHEHPLDEYKFSLRVNGGHKALSLPTNLLLFEEELERQTM
jgi:hypothetical protein